MKNQYLKVLMAVYCTAALMLPPMAWATLSAVVTSGYTFGPNEVPTIVTLNELGEPTIQIIGTVDGSTGLTPGSVTGTLLADSVPDGVTLTYNGASPRQLMIAQQGVAANQIAVLALGAGLLGGNGTAVFLNVDPNYFQLVTNSIANTNSISPTNDINNVPWLTFVPLSLTDTNVSLTAGVKVTKLQSGGTNSILASSPGATNQWEAQGPEFVNTPPTFTFLATNISGGTTNVTTNNGPWNFHLLTITTNIVLNNALTTYQIFHGFGAIPTVVKGWVGVYGTNVITTNVIAGVSTNIVTNAPNLTTKFVVPGSAIDWQSIYWFTNGNQVPDLTRPVFLWSADTNWVYVTEVGPYRLGVGNFGNAPFWGVETNGGAYGGMNLPGTNLQLNLIIRY